VYHEEHREHQEHRDLGGAEYGAQPGGRPDAIEARGQDDHGAGQRPRPPEVRWVSMEVSVDGARDGESELQQDERRDEHPAST
jgi:hypothetical protein